jgi:hypothetical protein
MADAIISHRGLGDRGKRGRGDGSSSRRLGGGGESSSRRFGSGDGNAGHGWPIRGREEEIGDGKWRKKMMTSGDHMSVIGERSCNKVYVFRYTCNWAHVRFICIPWHFCGNQRIAMIYFKIGEL